MASIVHADIVGIRTAEVGSAGYYVNSTLYSVLVFYSDGQRELVEGDANSIRQYLPYISPRNNYDQLESVLDRFEKKLIRDIRQIAYEVSNPVPEEIIGMGAKEAADKLKQSRFKVVYAPIAPGEKEAIVRHYFRKEDDPMTVVLELDYVLPDLKGKTAKEAFSIIASMGYTPKFNRVSGREEDYDKVLYADLKEDGQIVEIWINDGSSVNEKAFLNSIKSCKNVASIWTEWIKVKQQMKKPHIDVDYYLERERKSELTFGKKTDAQMEAIKRKIGEMLLQNR